MRTLFAVVLLSATVAAATAALLSENEVDLLFNEFADTYGKTYAHEGVRQYRRSVFAQNLAYINEHNTLAAAGLKTFTLAVNQFADLTNDEYRRGLSPVDLRQVSIDRPMHKIVAAAPDSKDWRDAGAVSKVKNQGQCGSCWSFSATGSMESAWFLAGNSLVTLSEQQLVDCSTSYGNMGCNGGLMTWAFQYAIDSGMESETAYAYTARGPLKCQYNKDKVVAHFSSYTNVSSGSESDLQNAVGTVAPVSIAIDAGHPSFQFYSNGVYNEPSCSSSRLDHGVLAVGYDTTQKGQAYWIVKNSWGSSWGQQGYIWMSRNANNQCGIATMANYPSS